MNAHFSPPRIFALLLGFCALRVCAEEKPKAPATKPPPEAELRAVITKGLGFLAKEGEAWMKSKDCNGCHHMPEMLWSHREAMQRGFGVDRKKFDEWLAWADEHSKERSPASKCSR